jgi:hypothetical protein
VITMPFYTLAETARRVADGTEPLVAIKEWVDGWNARQEVSLYQEKPAWIDQDIWYGESRGRSHAGGSGNHGGDNTVTAGFHDFSFPK